VKKKSAIEIVSSLSSDGDSKIKKLVIEMLIEAVNESATLTEKHEFFVKRRMYKLLEYARSTMYAENSNPELSEEIFDKLTNIANYINGCK